MESSGVRCCVVWLVEVNTSRQGLSGGQLGSSGIKLVQVEKSGGMRGGEVGRGLYSFTLLIEFSVW